MKPAMKILAAAAAVLGAASCAEIPPASKETISGYVTEAERLAGNDLKALLVLCKPAPAARPAQALIDKLIASQMARPAPEPGRGLRQSLLRRRGMGERLGDQDARRA